MKSIYSLIADYYPHFYAGILKLIRYQASSDYILKELPFERNEPIEVLDAGCGTGAYSLAILQRFPCAKITAFDLNPTMLLKTEKLLSQRDFLSRSKLFVADIRTPLPELTWRFDLVITSGVLEYTPLESTLPILSTYLSSGGRFLNVPTKQTFAAKYIASRVGLKMYSYDEMVRVFEENGFRLLKTIRLPWQYFPTCNMKEAFLFKP